MRSQPLLKLKAEKKRLTLRQRLIEVSRGFPARFEEQDDGTLKLELKVAERKVLLSRKTLMYRARVKVDDDRRTVKFFETLKETGLGLTSGDSTDMSPGLGFKKETYKITGRERGKYRGTFKAIRKRLPVLMGLLEGEKERSARD